METAEHREPYESRGSRTDLGAPGGESPPGDSTADLTGRLCRALAERDGLSWTRCHGDCHGYNAHIALQGPRAGQAVFFDFDDWRSRISGLRSRGVSP